MASEGIKQLKFAARVNTINFTTIVALITAGGRIRAEYISGSEFFNETSSVWTYNFLILERDIPSGMTFDSITESIFKAPYVEIWEEREDCTDDCRPVSSSETHNTDLPDYVGGWDTQAEQVDGQTVVCPSKMSAQDFATLITPLLDMEHLISIICPACDCTSVVPVNVLGNG